MQRTIRTVPAPLTARRSVLHGVTGVTMVVAMVVAMILTTVPAIPASSETRSDPAPTLALEVLPTGIKGEWLLPFEFLDGLEREDPPHPSASGPDTGSGHPMVDGMGEHLSVLVNGSPRPVRFYNPVLGTRAHQWWFKAEFAIDVRMPIETISVSFDSGLRNWSQASQRVEVHWPGSRLQSATLAAGAGAAHFQHEGSTIAEPITGVLDGMRHVWYGLDHMLFLITLMLPVLFTPGIHPDPPVRQRRRQVVLLVTTIALAQSLAQSLALNLAPYRLPWPEPWLLQAAAALPVLIAAGHNLLSATPSSAGLWLALGFGLLHGLDSASVLADSLPGGPTVVTPGPEEPGAAPLLRLLGLGVGSWLGQLAVAAALLPLAYLVRHRGALHRATFYGGSLAACAVSGFWIWQGGLPRGLLR